MIFLAPRALATNPDYERPAERGSAARFSVISR